MARVKKSSFLDVNVGYIHCNNNQYKISVLKIVQNEQKWLINVSEETKAINVTLDNGRSLTLAFLNLVVAPRGSSPPLFHLIQTS